MEEVFEAIENGLYEEFSSSGLSKEEFKDIVATTCDEFKKRMVERIGDW